jgi:flagella basal body P-ring formation protein FlgA
MMSRRSRDLVKTLLAAACFVAAIAAARAQEIGGAADIVKGSMGKAVVPVEVIYPGDVISPRQLKEVDVTNPNLTGDYARSSQEVAGFVSKRTLLPGRTIPMSALRQPFAVTRGSNARLIMTVGTMTICAAGTPLDDGAIGDVVRARNLDSGIIVSGTVLENGTIRVAAK